MKVHFCKSHFGCESATSSWTIPKVTWKKLGHFQDSRSSLKMDLGDCLVSASANCHLSKIAQMRDY